MKTAVVLTIAILANSIGNLMLTLGMRDFDISAPSAGQWFFHMAGHVVSDPWMIGGVILLIVFLSAYTTALSWADLSFVLPATAPAYILTVILAKVYLQEAVTPARWAGTALIIVGTCLVARSFASSSPRTEPAPQTASIQREVL